MKKRLFQKFQKSIHKITFILIAMLTFITLWVGNFTVDAVSPESIGSARIDEYDSKALGGSYGLAIRRPRYDNGRLTDKPIVLRNDMPQAQRKRILLIKRREHREEIIVNDTVSYGKLRFFRDPAGTQLLPTKEVMVGGSKDARGRYVFPCTLAGNAGIEWTSPSGQRKCKMQIPDRPRSPQRSRKSLQIDDQTKAYTPQKSSLRLARTLPQLGSAAPSLRRYYCSAVSTLGESPGFKGRAWDVEVSPSADLFSQEDPCQKAVRRCEQSNPGLACAVINTGEWTVDDTSELVAVTLNCAGQLINPEGKPISSDAVDDRINWLKQTAQTNGQGSCVLDIHGANEIILSPGSEASRYGVIAQAESQGDGIVVRAMQGSVDVQFTDPNQAERIARISPDKECTFFPLQGTTTDEECQKAIPIAATTKEQILENAGFQALLNPEILAEIRNPTEGVDLEGKTARSNRCLGGTIAPPSGWKLIQNRKHLKIAEDYIQQEDPRLAAAYVNLSLSLLQQKNSTLGSLFQAEVNRYRSLNQCELLAIDTQGLASVSIDRRKFLDVNSIEGLVQDYRKQVQQVGDPKFIKLINQPTQNLTINGEPAWVVKTEITLKGAYGQQLPAYQKDPPIGAGRTVYQPGRKGDSVSLAHVSYLFKNKFAGNQDEYFVMSFITPQPQLKQYEATFKTVAQSFRFLKTNL